MARKHDGCPMQASAGAGMPGAGPTWLMPHRRSRSTMAGILALPREVPCNGAATRSSLTSHAGPSGSQHWSGSPCLAATPGLRQLHTAASHPRLAGNRAARGRLTTAALQPPGPSPTLLPGSSLPATHQHGAALELDAVDRLAAQLHRLGVAVQEATQAIPDAKDLVLGHPVVVLQGRGGRKWGRDRQAAEHAEESESQHAAGAVTALLRTAVVPKLQVPLLASVP